MKGNNKLAIVAAAVAAFVASSVWYAVFGNATMELSGIGPAAAADPAYTALFVVAQSLVVAFVLSYFVVRLGVTGPKDAVRLGVLVWIFPAMILLGSVVHENVPWMLATIHAGDWLVKLVLMAAILGAWRGGPSEAKGVR
jgi:Protein of unknown function (DUF1761)